MVTQVKPQINARTLRGGADILLDGRPSGCRTRSDILVRDAHSNRGQILLKPERSWAFHAAVVDEAIARGCTAVLVIDHDTGATYYTEMDNFLAQGQRFNYGRGEQIRLALRHWRQNSPAADAAPANVSRETLPQPEPAPQQQLGLFEVTR